MLVHLIQSKCLIWPF